MNNKKIRILKLAAADFIIFAVLLCVFCWFHHVELMWYAENDDIIAVPDDDIEIGDKTPETKEQTDTDTDTEIDTSDSGEVTDSDAEADTEAESETETETETESEPEPEKHKWEELFTPEGTVEQTDTMYRSHNIYLTVEEVYREFDGYISKYYIYDFYLRDINCLKAVYSESRHYIEDYTEADKSIAAVSGDYWMNNSEISVKNGNVLRQENVGENDFCVLYYDGVMKTYRNTALPSYEITDNVYQIWSFGPALLSDEGEAMDNFEDYSSYLAKAHPRSSIGYFEPGHYCFIVVEGRRHVRYEGERVYTAGIKLSDLSAVYEELGCVAAYNLDGGDSAYGYYNGEILRQDWDRANEEDKSPRKIYDIISISEIE